MQCSFMAISWKINKMNDFQPTLYIVMFKDVPDMNPGKGMAQAAHAQAEFDIYVLNNSGTRNRNLDEAHQRWTGINNVFGRTIILSAWSDLRIQSVTTTVKHTRCRLRPVLGFLHKNISRLTLI